MLEQQNSGYINVLGWSSSLVKFGLLSPLCVYLLSPTSHTDWSNLTVAAAAVPHILARLLLAPPLSGQAANCHVWMTLLSPSAARRCEMAWDTGAGERESRVILNTGTCMLSRSWRLLCVCTPDIYIDIQPKHLWCAVTYCWGHVVNFVSPKCRWYW